MKYSVPVKWNSHLALRMDSSSVWGGLENFLWEMRSKMDVVTMEEVKEVDHKREGTFLLEK